MSGKRRRPWIVRLTTGYDIDAKTGTFKQKQETLGYRLSDFVKIRQSFRMFGK